MSARERLAHLFEKYDKARDNFLEARARERMILDVLKREGIDHADESRPE